nr:transposase [Serratia proteamaculans]
MAVPEVKRLKPLEEENARLKKLLAEAILDKEALLSKSELFNKAFRERKKLRIYVTCAYAVDAKPAGLPLSKLSRYNDSMTWKIMKNAQYL